MPTIVTCHERAMYSPCDRHCFSYRHVRSLSLFLGVGYNDSTLDSSSRNALTDLDDLLPMALASLRRQVHDDRARQEIPASTSDCDGEHGWLSGRLRDPLSLAGRFGLGATDTVGLFEHPIDAGWAAGDDVPVERYEGESPVSFEGKLVVEVDDGFLLRLFEPVVSRDEGVMLVDLSVASFPIVELSGSQCDPVDDSRGRQFASSGPAIDVVDDLVSGIVEARTAADRTGRKEGGPR